ncbi:flagellar biosynthetic protein FliO [Pseudaeromonas paramecii]|uniref:Flagellar protein n=1 Tax=Pseudaeromonas paramecii TaxID=2138166 RepID=A0ABP8Q5L2_9GAMM
MSSIDALGAAVSGAATSSPGVLGTGGLASWLLSCALVIGLILALGWLLKKTRLNTRLTGSGLKVVASLALGYKERLLVVQVGQQQLLIGATPQQISLLCQLDEPLAPNAPFAQQLRKVLKQDETD